MSGEVNESPYKVIPKDHCAAIGLVAITWADFELTIDRAIWALMDVDHQVGACLTAQFNSMFHRMNALASLAGQCGISDDLCAEITKLAGKIGYLSEERNRAVHDARFLAIETGTVKRFQSTAKRKLEFDWKPESIDGLHQTASAMSKAKLDFLAIWDRVATENLCQLPRRRLPRKKKFHDLGLTSLDTKQKEPPPPPPPSLE